MNNNSLFLTIYSGILAGIMAFAAVCGMGGLAVLAFRFLIAQLKGGF